ncbi:MAG: hypothetical protein R2794_12910 [Chitinophagales bacterium]
MHFKSFSITDPTNIHIHLDGDLDLHNNWLLTRVEYIFASRTVRIYWKVSTGAWVPEYAFNAFYLEFRNVTLFRAKELDERSVDEFVEDDTILAMIGLTRTDEPEFRGVLDYTEIRDEKDCMCIYTENGQVFVIHAEIVEFMKVK